MTAREKLRELSGRRLDSGSVDALIARFDLPKSLTEEERRKLSLELVPDESEMDPEIEAAWMAEAKRRFDELDKGIVKAIPWEEARKRLFENR